jgi:uncharacterized protein
VSAPLESVHKQFTAALDELVEQIKRDRSILAVILCGSLSHDTVWEKSDIDLGLITIDDKIVERETVALYAGGVNVHAFLMTRGEFRLAVEGEVRNSFFHSLLAKGRLLYTHDETIARLCGRLKEIGERDTVVQLLSAAAHAVSSLDKAHKWFATRGDLDYTALWILYTATPLAKIELMSARLLVDREAIPQAMKLNPSFFQTIYTDMLNSKKTRKSVQAALDAIDAYMAKHAPRIFAPVLEHLQEVGEARSCGELDAHFKRNFGIGSVTPACEYLANQKLIGKASVPVKLTKRSSLQVQELAFVHLGDVPDEF